MKNRIVPRAFIHAFAELAYISFVSWVMFNGQALFGQQKDSFVSPIVFLLLFVISALISGLLILAKPAMLFMEGSRKEAVNMLIYTLGFLILFFFIAVFFLMQFGKAPMQL
jgi:hypothetical protein